MGLVRWLCNKCNFFENAKENKYLNSVKAHTVIMFWAWQQELREKPGWKKPRKVIMKSSYDWYTEINSYSTFSVGR